MKATTTDWSNIVVKEGRHYHLVPRHAFCGFPADGIWFVKDESETLLLDATEFASRDYDPLIMASLFHHDPTLSRVLLESHWRDRPIDELLRQEIYPNLRAPDGPARMRVRPVLSGTPRSFWTRRNRRYIFLGDEFAGFPANGIWHVVDGRRNVIVKLANLPTPARRDAVERHHDDVVTELERFLSRRAPLSVAAFLRAFYRAAARAMTAAEKHSLATV